MATFSGFAAEAALGRFHRAQRLQLDLKLGQPDHSEYFIFFYWSFGDLKLCTHVRENQSNDGVLCCCWVTKSYLTLWPHELQHARFPCPSLSSGVFSNSCPLSQWTLNIQWKDWCWRSNTLSTWCEEPTHWKIPWCWERLRAGGEGGDRGWWCPYMLLIFWLLFMIFCKM